MPEKEEDARAHIVFVCGVCGAGKTTVGRALAVELGGGFLDADDLHPPENRAKLARGTPLDGADREPWLAAVADAAAAAAAPNAIVVVACSALKRSYRDILRQRAGAASGAAQVDFVLLDVPEALLRARLADAAADRSASHHPLPNALPLLPSQLATLERGGSLPDEWAAVFSEEEDGQEEELAPAGEVARALAAKLRARWEAKPAASEGQQR
jgi:gluconokinase